MFTCGFILFFWHVYKVSKESLFTSRKRIASSSLIYDTYSSLMRFSLAIFHQISHRVPCMRLIRNHVTLDLALCKLYILIMILFNALVRSFISVFNVNNTSSYTRGLLLLLRNKLLQKCFRKCAPETYQ